MPDSKHPASAVIPVDRWPFKELLFFGVLIPVALGIVALSAIVPLWVDIVALALAVLGAWRLLDRLFPP